MYADLEQKNLLLEVKDVQLKQHTSAIQRLTVELRETEDRVRQKETQLQQKNADISRLQREVQRLQVSTLLCLCSRPWFLGNFAFTVYAMPALISHASGFCALYCTYGRATWGKSACTKLFIATLQI